MRKRINLLAAIVAVSGLSVDAQMPDINAVTNISDMKGIPVFTKIGSRWVGVLAAMCGTVPAFADSIHFHEREIPNNMLHCGGVSEGSACEPQ